MTVPAMTAINAYSAAARTLGDAVPAQDGAGPVRDPAAFSSMVQDALGGVTESGQAVEARTAELADGKADVVDLVTAVAETELAVETLVTVRDRMISAYQEVLNMPI